MWNIILRRLSMADRGLQLRELGAEGILHLGCFRSGVSFSNG
jgi:hypothetical protein